MSAKRILKNNQGGNVLLIIAGVMAMLSLMVDSVLLTYDANMRSLDAFRAKRQAFYISEGARAITTALLENYLMNNPDPQGADIAAYLDGQLATLVPNPYSVTAIQVEVLQVNPNATITSGPFAGMVGPITNLLLRFNVETEAGIFSGNLSEPLELRLSVAYISMFQFMAFYDVQRALIQTGPEMHMRGRIHANSDLCVGGSSGFNNFLRVTAGGRFMSNADGRCGGGGGTSRTRVSTNQNYTAFADFTNAADNGCTNCAGSGLAWDAFAIARWRQQVQDTAHGVQVLRLPGAGMGLVQTRESGAAGPAVNNNNNLRFAIDPVLPTDTATVRSYKFAHNSDIRIINGVWYLRNMADPMDWPGVPIWSDHPGRFTEFGKEVGQEDIRDYWAATRPWPAAPATPRAYSYYEYNTSTQSIFDDPTGVGVISYGTLQNSGAGTTPQKPGHWVNNGASPICAANGAVNCAAGGCGFRSVWAAPMTCPGLLAPGRDPSYATNILNATRSGFRNGHILEMSPGNAAERGNRSRVLPINIDIQQLQDALSNNNPGELGSYFGAGNYMNEPFNGIVYISSSWPGGTSGYGVGGPSEWPFQGAINDTDQINITHPNLQRALPQPLCSNAVTEPWPGFAGLPFDGQGPIASIVARFRIPDCADYAAGGAYPNAVRVINGTNLNRAILTRGISVVSNLPVYLVGDYNTNSNVTTVNAAPWTPSLVAGDKVGLISNAWSDARSQWSVLPSAMGRIATNTTYNTSLLTEPSVTLTSLHEDWTNRDLTVNGSMVYGYNAVYAQHDNFCCGDRTYDPPDRTFNFDPHYGLITNQPPGTPVFPVSATAMWTKAK